MKKIKILLAVAVLCMTAALCVGCSAKKETASPAGEQHSLDYSGENPLVTIRVKDYGEIRIELYPDKAPNTVNNFISLARSGFYDGLLFHRVIEDFMIQTGDPQGTGMGGPGYTIPGEFTMNGFENDLSHTRGVISMARAGRDSGGVKAFDSAGSQFFIVHQDSTSLDKQYAAFGKVLSGMEVVDAIAGAKTDAQDRPVTDIVMEKVTVETFGKTYAEPEKA